MKRILLLPLAITLLASCEREVGLLDEREEPRLVVNAMITAGTDSQQVHICTTGLYHAEDAAGADVSILQNGTVAHTGYADESGSLVFSAKAFGSNDELAIEARHGNLHAGARVKVPAPIIITGLDTTTVRVRRSSSFTNLERHTRYLVHLQQPEGYDSRETHYYRAEVYKDILSTTMDADHDQFTYSSDPALSESENDTQDDLPIEFDWLAGVGNKYHVFRDAYFVDGKYDLRLDLPYPFYASSRDWSQHVTIRIYSITETEYFYLQSLAVYTTLDKGTIFDTEPGITSNVEGGAGIFCVESVSTISFMEEHLSE
jgi:hypothetical protein